MNKKRQHKKRQNSHSIITELKDFFVLLASNVNPIIENLHAHDANILYFLRKLDVCSISMTSVDGACSLGLKNLLNRGSLHLEVSKAHPISAASGKRGNVDREFCRTRAPKMRVTQWGNCPGA